jgi:hypothetical protein
MFLANSSFASTTADQQARLIEELMQMIRAARHAQATASERYPQPEGEISDSAQQPLEDAIAHEPAIAPEQEMQNVRIYAGRRVIYGQLAEGELRNEITIDHAEELLAAMQQPQSTADTAQYARKDPNYVIKIGDEVFLRQERDETVTVNRFQPQLNLESPKFEPVSQEQDTVDWTAKDELRVASLLLNPLDDERLIYDRVEIFGYEISQDSHGSDTYLQITKDHQPVLIAKNGEVVFEDGHPEQHHILQQAIPRQEQVFWVAEVPQPQVDPALDPSREVVVDRHIPATLKVNNAIDSFPEGGTKQLLQTTVNDQAPNRARQAVDWLVSRPEAWQDHQTSRSILNLFKRGYERTGESSYGAGNYSISFHGKNIYSLSDVHGTLVKFKVSNSPIPLVTEPRIDVLEKSDRLGSFHRQSIKSLKDEGIIPQGSPDVEALYLIRVQRAERTIQSFMQLQKVTSWEQEGLPYKFEIGDRGFMQITDQKSWRGVIYQREAGKVISKLNTTDFARFERMQQGIQQYQQAQQNQAPKKSKGLEVD